MYEELKEKLQPLPKFDLTWATDENEYSEGDVEDLIIKMIAENPVEDYGKAVCNQFNWSTYYHLTPTRKNILNWYPFKKEGRVLEIGCGLGSITNMLCEKCSHVTSVELSERRATATLLRCRDKENLEIIVGNLNDIEFTEKFDYITLIGVLEYQENYTNERNPFVAFLSKIKSLLKPDGVLLIAIENQFGLKYWCGAREDHTGTVFDGMNHYMLGNRNARTFSRESLKRIVKQSGFKNSYFYYPLPDYKLPSVVYSDNALPKEDKMENMSVYYFPDRKTLIANERALYQDVIENNVFPFFANSFLVECSDRNDVGEVTFATLSSRRQKEYRTGTIFKKDYVQRIALEKECSLGHLSEILKNAMDLQAHGLKVVPCTDKNGEYTMPYWKEPLLEHKILEAAVYGDTRKYEKYFEQILEEVMRSSEEGDYKQGVLANLVQGDFEIEKFGPVLKRLHIDMIPRNAFYKEESNWWFDSEWILEHTPASFTLFRGIMELYLSYPELEEFYTKEKLHRHFGITADVEQYYNNLNNIFFQEVVDSYEITAMRALS